jgi:hypothetical protein
MCCIFVGSTSKFYKAAVLEFLEVRI